MAWLSGKRQSRPALKPFFAHAPASFISSRRACLLVSDSPQVVEVFEDDIKKRLVKCGGISLDRPAAFDIPTKVPCA